MLFRSSTDTVLVDPTIRRPNSIVHHARIPRACIGRAQIRMGVRERRVAARRWARPRILARISEIRAAAESKEARAEKGNPKKPLHKDANHSTTALAFGRARARRKGFRPSVRPVQYHAGQKLLRSRNPLSFPEVYGASATFERRGARIK